MSKGFVRTNISFTLTRKSFTLRRKGYIYSFRWGGVKLEVKSWMLIIGG